MSVDTTISLAAEAIRALDLSPIRDRLGPILNGGKLAEYEQQFRLAIDYPCEPGDPRELSEIPEIRLWFVRLDSCYPWMPFFLDARAGELARYAAMLLPHEFNRSEGIQYNPQALEIFVMHKAFVLHDWLQERAIAPSNRIRAMMQTLGYDLDDAFFQLLGS